MIKTIAHLADIHVPKSLERHEEYKKIFNKIYPILKEKSPDRIVVVGDTYDSFVDLEGEALIIIGDLFNKLSEIAPVIIIRGNHEIRKQNRSRIDTVKTITDLLQNPRITYYNKTGFYPDDNVVWVVWDHVEHRYDGIDPWKNFPTKKDKTKTYIDLYHDQIDGCKYYAGFKPDNRKYPKVSDFKGDYSLLGDIHLRQFFGKTKAYPGSLVQVDIGEDPFDHGFLIWNIEDGSVEEFNIENEYAMIKFIINPDQDYDKLKLTSKHVAKYNKFRVDWNDYAPNITNDNENKIRKYLKDKYDATNVEIKPNRIYTDIKDGKMLSEVIDINNKKVQQDLIKEYLKDNKFQDDFIEQIINIDNIVNNRLQLSDARNIVWNIDKFWFTNFKSYGDDNVIEWDKINGVVQIGGENQQGKTSIIDAICFILYGTTISTIKTEKNGNNRYINKNRNKNYCEGGAVLDINGEKYIMNRRVEREFKKGKEIKAVPMTLDYYKSVEMTDENKLNGERRTSTQKFIDGVLGDFNDFIRMALTNADNLNSLLSMDRSVFIDSIIRDAGYDIFEKKLNEFKEYKKELNLEKINVNRIEMQNEINKITEDLSDKEDFLSDINNDIKDIDDEIKEKVDLKDDLLIKLHKIDDSIIYLNIDDVKRKIRESKKEKDELQIDIDDLNKDVVVLPDKFDNENFDKLVSQYDKYIAEKNKRDIEIVQLNNLYRQNEDKINNVDKDINIEKTKYIDYLRNNIAGLKIELRETINEINNNAGVKKNNLENKKNKYKNELNNLKQSGLDEKKNIADYTNMLNGENQICIVCNQPIINKNENHINNLINESIKKIEDITKIGKQKLELLNECNTKIDSLSSISDKLINEKKFEFENKIKDIQYKIDNFNVAYIQDRIQEVLNNKDKAELENQSLDNKIDERKKYMGKIETEIKRLSLTVTSLKVDKSLNEKYKNLAHNRDILISRIKDFQKIFEDNSRLLSDYDKNKQLIIENEKTNSSLSEIKTILDNINRKRGELIDSKLYYSNEIILNKKVLNDSSSKLEKYIEQEKREEIHNVYLKLMHRTGLPTYLLTKNIDILNDELNSLLTNINFTLFFDEDLNLKLQHDGLDDIINVIETSGMERTFSAIILKMVLRIINFKSKPNFMFLDEVINRLFNKSVNKFIELLETLRNKIDKIIVIEHNNDIWSDMIINVVKDDKGISSFEIII